MGNETKGNDPQDPGLESQGTKGSEGQDVKLDSGDQIGDSSVEGKGPANGTGWTTSLPKELRGLIDTGKYPTLAAYVQAHADGGKQTENPGQEEDENKETGSSETETDYSGFTAKFADDVDPFGYSTESLVSVLKENNIPLETAQKVFDAIEQSRVRSTSQLLEKGKEFCDSKCKEMWGSDYDANRNAMTRGVVALVGDDQSMKDMLDSTGASINPAVAELFKRVGLMLKEGTPPRSNGSSAFDPKNPYGY